MGFVCVILLSFSITVTGVWGQCTFPTTFADQTWRDNTRGTLTFTNTTMSGWGLTVYGTILNDWECVAQTDLQLVLRSTSTATFALTTFYAYVCLQLTKITDNSYIYYQKHAQQPNAGFERAKFFVDTSLTTASEICDYTAVIPTLEFHVLVKQGNELAAAITCPDSLLYSADYQYQDSNVVTCNNTDDVWDVCTDMTTMTFNYTTCSQMIAYSAGGVLTCVASVGACAVVYNQDTTLAAGGSQFACICSNGGTASVAPGNCTSDQTASAFPTAADGVTAVGYLLNYGTKYVSCGPSSDSSGLSAGAIAGIVVCVLIVVAIAICVPLFLYMSKRRKKENRVSEGEKPILADGMSARVESVDETSKASKLNRESSNISYKGKVQRNATLGSIGLDMKSNREKSTVSKIDVKPREDKDKKQSSTLFGKILPILPCCREREKDISDEKKPEPEREPRLQMCGKDLSFLVCCPEKKEQDIAKGTIVIVEPTKPQSPKKEAKSGNKSPKGKPKGKASKEKKSTESQTDAKEGGDTKQTTTPKTGRKKKGKTHGDGAMEDETGPQRTSTPKPDQKAKAKLEVESPKLQGRKVVSSPILKSTSPKPEGKAKDWTFLACCYGNRSPPAPEDSNEVVEKPKTAVPKGRGTKGKSGTKDTTKGKPAKKAAAKKGGGKGKKNASKSTENIANGNANDLKIEDVEEIPNGPERSKTMPEKVREKTALSVKDAEKVKVDVYIPDDKTKLHLKDTVTVVKEKNGIHMGEKSKSALGLTRGDSASAKERPKSSAKKSGKSDDKKAKKEGGKSKDKKQKKKRK